VRGRPGFGVLVRELLGEAIGTLVETLATWRLEVALLSLVLCLLVGVHEVASASIVAIALLLLSAPDLLLARLVGVYRLRERRGCRRECPAGFLLVLVVSVAAAEAEIELQAVALLVVVHGGRPQSLRRGSRCGGLVGGCWVSSSGAKTKSGQWRRLE
jgi:hypothetical protein